MRSIVVFLSLLLMAPAIAHAEPLFSRSHAHQAEVHQTQAPDHNPLDCYCRAQGRIFAPGEKICLKTAEGPRLAQCRMEINVMSWSITEAACPET